MKKILTWFFSVALIAAAAAPASADQAAKKLTGKNVDNKATVTATMQAQKAPQKSAKGKLTGFDRFKTKTAKTGFSTQKSVASTPKFKGLINHAAGDYPEIYASILYSDDSKNYGLYSIPTSSTNDFELILPLAASANYGGVAVDGYYYFNSYESVWGILNFFYVYGYDMETGEMVMQLDVESDPSVLAPGGLALDPTTNNVYGLLFTSDLQAQRLAKVEYGTNSVNTTTIREYADENFVAFAIDNTGQFYGIMTDEYEGGAGVLVKIDRTTGDYNIVGSTGQIPYYLSGATIDPKTNRMFWTVSPEDETGILTEVNLTTGVAEVIAVYPQNDEIGGLFIPAPEAEDGAPAAVTNLAANFTEDALTGTVTFTAPSETFGGDALTGNLTVTLLVNGNEESTLTVAAGAQGTFNVTVPAAGQYTFTVYATNSVGNGPKENLKNIWIGADTPAATKATAVYANGNMEITWLPVTEGLNGGYISDVTYTVKTVDGETLASGLTTTTYTYAVAMPDEITAYQYVVFVVSGNFTSQGAYTNTVMLGSIVPPYVADFATNGLEGWTIIDANNDNKVWEVQSNGSVRMTYNSSKDMDDWLITPPLKLEAGKGYNVSFKAGSQSTTYPEELEVMWGTNNTAEGMTNTLLAPTTITTTYSSGGQNFTEMLMPEEDGVYYVGFHGISEADQYYLFLGDIQIESGVSTAAPGLASDLLAESVRNGSNFNAVISFNAPAKTMAGADLASLTKVELYRGETLINTFNAPTPGAALSYTDATPANGVNTYTVIGYNDAGAGLKATTSVFVGFDVPNAPLEATISRTAVEGEVTFEWTPVTEDVNGTPLTAADVKYIVCEYDNGWVPIAENLSTTSYTYQAVPAGEQDFVQLAVFAETAAGTGTGTASEMIPVGTPYQGLDETFADGTLSYIWGAGGNASVNIGTDSTFSDLQSATGDNGYIYFQAQYLDYYGNLFTGLVSLNQMVNPGLTFYTYNIVGDSPDINEISVAVKTLDSEEWETILPPTTVVELCDGIENDWGKVTISLAEYANQTIQVQLTAVVKQYTNTFFDDIKIGSILGYDLTAKSISAPAKVKAGADYTVDVTVQNNGANAAAAYTVELYSGDTLVASQNMTNLEAAKATTVGFELTMSPLATEPVSYYAKVVFAQDENEADNQTSTITIQPVVSTLPVATDLEATASNDGVVLTWNEPNLEGGVPEPVTDDFEDADGVAAEYGNWLFVDLDKSAVGGFQNMDVPGITPGTTTGSFWIWDNELIGGNQTFDAHSGNHYLFALFRYDDGTTNDWAISPKLTGEAQTISFYARSYSTQYPEKIQVLYSTNDNITADSFNENLFTLVEGSTVNSVPGDWTLYEANLPVGAKYFAIRSFATGSFMLMIDDVTYTPEGVTADLEIAGYNVYRDGVQINDTLVEDTSYTDNVEPGLYTYVVTVVYTDRGESAASNSATVEYTSGVAGVDDAAISITVEGKNIVVANAQGSDVTVVNAAGAVLFSGKGSAKTVVEATKGIYVVKAGNKVAKVLVK